MKTYKISLFIAAVAIIQQGLSQIPVKDIPGLIDITFHERTVIGYMYTYAIDATEINTKLIGTLGAGNRDFEGVPNKEFYDVYYSDQDGNLDLNGAYVNIDARYDMSSGGGALNISEIEFNFNNGTSIYGRYIASFVSNGTNYIPGSEERAADCNLNTWSTMGNTENTSIRLRVTIGLLDEPSTIIEEDCMGSGYEVIVNNVSYNESNPLGIEIFPDDSGCDSIVYIDLTFFETYSTDVIYEGCVGDGYSVVINGTTYDELNPSGEENLFTQFGCDSIFIVNLIFIEPLLSEFIYQGCQGDGYSIDINGTIYDEINAFGEETMTASNGCDSIITVSLFFNPISTGDEYYTGCSGDGYSVVVNGTVYSESLPEGIETLLGSKGCDSVVSIALVFNPTSDGNETYTGCSGDGYSVDVNGTVYDENNPEGFEILTGSNGCDSIVTVDLTFFPQNTGTETYSGCSGSGYFVIINGTLYNENNPIGIEILTSNNGCDSIIAIDLTFYPVGMGSENYFGCIGSGYSVTVNGNVYDANNPNGTEILTTSNGCDSIVTISLTFVTELSGEELFIGCTGDGYSVIVGGTMYDESNPNGMEILMSQDGCDSIVTISLIFNSSISVLESYNGCSGDGYALVVNGTTYNENNPLGIETIPRMTGCDSIISISLTYNPTSAGEVNYTGCSGDGYTIVVNSIIYDEGNPMGVEILNAANGCDSIVTISLTYLALENGSITYAGCLGDGYSISVNGTLYDENNPTGAELLTGSNGCDSLVSINLNFTDIVFIDMTYSGCSGDDYSIIVNGTTYDETHPIGFETLSGANGCDSVVMVSLIFLTPTSGSVTYVGCLGDGFSILVNGILYDENNPVGVETILGHNNCDSIVTIELSFANNILIDETYSGCSGNGYFIIVNGTTYDENNPAGMEVFDAGNGCDTVVNIFLTFNPVTLQDIIYEGCSEDGYFVNVNGSIYDETRPQGIEILSGSNGCDSIVYINLLFREEYLSKVEYQGCSGDGFSIEVNSSIYNESNPLGEEYFISQDGCDSVVTISLRFAVPVFENIMYQGCEGDGYFIVINDMEYNESHPIGSEILPSQTGCDSIIQILLEYEDCFEHEKDCSYFVPNIISTNRDGINDSFRFYFADICVIRLFQIDIFDRWGDHIYKSIIPEFEWYGEFNDQVLNPGVYVYRAEILFANENSPTIKYGDITLIK